MKGGVRMKKYLIFLIGFIFVASVAMADETGILDLLTDQKTSEYTEPPIETQAIGVCYDFTLWSQTQPMPSPFGWMILYDNDTFYGEPWGAGGSAWMQGIWGTLKPAFTDYIISLEFGTGCRYWCVSTFDFSWSSIAGWYIYDVYQGYCNCRDGSSGAAVFWRLEPGTCS